MSLTHVPASLRRLVRERARECCEYCLISEAFTLFTHSIDHVIAEKHGGETIADNLALACVICNGHKGTDLTSIDPGTGAIVLLFNPRRDRWLDHFRIEDGRIDPLTATGRVTVRLLRFNAEDRVAERRLLIEASKFVVPE